MTVQETIVKKKPVTWEERWDYAKKHAHQMVGIAKGDGNSLKKLKEIRWKLSREDPDLDFLNHPPYNSSGR